MQHHFTLRVYYEDTDLAGIVYYANYLKYIERARTEWVRSLGVDQTALKAEGLVFAVRRLQADYLKPAHFDDELRVDTIALAATGARLLLEQTALRGTERLFVAQVTLVCLTETGHPARIPATLRQKLSATQH